MRNPQGHYSFDAYFYKALQTVAEAYGLSASEYVARILAPIVKAEMVNLDLPLRSMFSDIDLEDFTKREMQKRYKKLFCHSQYMVETEEAFIAFQNYIVRQYGYQPPGEVVNQVTQANDTWSVPEIRRVVPQPVQNFHTNHYQEATQTVREQIQSPVQSTQMGAANQYPTEQQVQVQTTNTLQSPPVQEQPTIQQIPVKTVAQPKVVNTNNITQSTPVQEQTVVKPTPPAPLPKVEESSQTPPVKKKSKFGKF